MFGRPRPDIDVENLKQLRASGVSLARSPAEEQLTLTTVARMLREAA